LGIHRGGGIPLFQKNCRKDLLKLAQMILVHLILLGVGLSELILVESWRLAFGLLMMKNGGCISGKDT